jgi:hypothetical protein
MEEGYEIPEIGNLALPGIYWGAEKQEMQNVATKACWFYVTSSST